MSNAQWYERFNTRYEVAKLVGVQFDQCEALWEYCAGLRGPGVTYSSLFAVDQSKVRESAKERYLAYLFIQNSGSQHELL